MSQAARPSIGYDRAMDVRRVAESLRFLLRLPDLDRGEVRAQFARRDMLEVFHELSEAD